jgi:hypothetical protein
MYIVKVGTAKPCAANVSQQLTSQPTATHNDLHAATAFTVCYTFCSLLSLCNWLSGGVESLLLVLWCWW